ncbi:MAG: class I SAM-dependent methyltransferase [Patescibacteria group bacterium]
MQKKFLGKKSGINTSWDESAQWYHGLVGEKGMELQKNVVFPKTLQLLDLKPHEKLLDVACGQGAFCRHAVRCGSEIVGVDASPQLIGYARRVSPKQIRFIVGDVRKLPREVAEERFDAISCILAIANVDPLKPVFEECKKVLKPSGRMVLVLSHPCFRIPRQSGWGWDEQRKLQYRRVDRYLSEMKIPIQMHPGMRSREITWTFHRPLNVYVRALREVGFVIDALEEWPTSRRSTPGTRASADQRSKEEIPLFLAMKAVRKDSDGR